MVNGALADMVGQGHLELIFLVERRGDLTNSARFMNGLTRQEVDNMFVTSAITSLARKLDDRMVERSGFKNNLEHQLSKRGTAQILPSGRAQYHLSSSLAYLINQNGRDLVIQLWRKRKPAKQASGSGKIVSHNRTPLLRNVTNGLTRRKCTYIVRRINVELLGVTSD